MRKCLNGILARHEGDDPLGLMMRLVATLGAIALAAALFTPLLVAHFGQISTWDAVNEIVAVQPDRQLLAFDVACIAFPLVGTPLLIAGSLVRRGLQLVLFSIAGALQFGPYAYISLVLSGPTIAVSDFSPFASLDGRSATELVMDVGIAPVLITFTLCGCVGMIAERKSVAWRWYCALGGGAAGLSALVITVVRAGNSSSATLVETMVKIAIGIYCMSAIRSSRPNITGKICSVALLTWLVWHAATLFRPWGWVSFGVTMRALGALIIAWLLVLSMIRTTHPSVVECAENG